MLLLIYAKCVPKKEKRLKQIESTAGSIWLFEQEGRFIPHNVGTDLNGFVKNQGGNMSGVPSHVKARDKLTECGKDS